MKSMRSILKPTSLSLAALMLFFFAPVHTALAAMIATDSVVQGPSAEDARAAIHRLLARQDVQEGLIAQGVDPAEAHRRVAALSDEEAVRLAGLLDDLPAGGGVIGFIVVLILVVFLVLLVTDLTGLTDVFPWVK